MNEAASFLRAEIKRQGGELPPLAAKPPSRGPRYSGEAADVAEMLRQARRLFDDDTVDASSFVSDYAERVRRAAEHTQSPGEPARPFWDPLHERLTAARLGYTADGQTKISNIPPGAVVVINRQTGGVRIETEDGRPLPIRIDAETMMNDLFG